MIFISLSFFVYVVLSSTANFQDIITQPSLCKEEAKKIEKQPPSDSKDAVQKFFILLCAGKEKEAENMLRFADDKFPPDFYVKFNLANLYLQKGRVDFAVFLFNQAKLIKEIPAIFDSLANAYLIYGDIDSAQKALDEGISKFKKVQDEKEKKIVYQMILKRGMIHLIKGELGKAEIDFQEALSFDNTSPYALIGLAEVKGRKGEIKAGKEIIERATTIFDSPEILLYSGAYLHSRGYFEEATNYYIRAVDKLSGVERYISFFMLGTIMRDIGKYQDSRDFFKKAYEYQKLTTVTPPFSEIKRMELVKKYIELGNIKGAESEIREIVKLFPENLTAYKLLVEILLVKALLFLPKDQKIKTLEEVRDIAKKYLDRFPADDIMLYNFAIVNLWLAEIGPKFARSGNIFHAISALQSALKIKNDPEYRKLLGLSYYLIEKYDSAIEELQKVPQDNRIKLILASAFLKNGQPKEAEKVLNSIDQKSRDQTFYILLYNIIRSSQSPDKGKMSEIEKVIFGNELEFQGF
jgi:tetratricopeptide (TPR) repeat protein